MISFIPRFIPAHSISHWKLEIPSYWLSADLVSMQQKRSCYLIHFISIPLSVTIIV